LSLISAFSHSPFPDLNPYKISEQGGETVGYRPIDGYDFNESKAVVDGKFLGLAIDEDNQSDLTESRIKSWVSQLKREFSL